LRPYLGDPIPREQWDAEAWKAYAQFLEEQGKYLVHDLRRFEEDLCRAKMRLSRRKANNSGNEPAGSVTGLLFIHPEKKKAGRKKSSKTETCVREVLAIREEMETAMPRVTDKMALEEWYARQGLRRSRARNKSARTILNAISKSRKNHKISKNSG
jgi:hypothetical protein